MVQTNNIRIVSCNRKISKDYMRFTAFLETRLNPGTKDIEMKEDRVVLDVWLGREVWVVQEVQEIL
jgi:hypothetical protein